jgi:hypothetical protein
MDTVAQAVNRLLKDHCEKVQRGSRSRDYVSSKSFREMAYKAFASAVDRERKARGKLTI